MHDRVHQPFRAALVPGLAEALALDATSCSGLIGACLSGAGPTILALCSPPSSAQQVGHAIEQIFAKHGIRSRSLRALVQPTGATVVRGEI
jgi:homoserine kinase